MHKLTITLPLIPTCRDEMPKTGIPSSKEANEAALGLCWKAVYLCRAVFPGQFTIHKRHIQRPGTIGWHTRHNIHTRGGVTCIHNKQDGTRALNIILSAHIITVWAYVCTWSA